MRNRNSTVVQNKGPGGSQLVTGTDPVRIRAGSGSRISLGAKVRQKCTYPTIRTADLYSKLEMYITFVAMASTSDATQISVNASRSLFLTDSHGQTEKDYLSPIILTWNVNLVVNVVSRAVDPDSFNPDPDTDPDIAFQENPDSGTDTGF
jgi:hypothetical protein